MNIRLNDEVVEMIVEILDEDDSHITASLLRKKPHRFG